MAAWSAGQSFTEILVLLYFCWTPATRKMQRRIVKSASPVIEDSFQRKQMTRRSHAAFTWVFVNVILAATFFAELWVASASFKSKPLLVSFSSSVQYWNYWTSLLFYAWIRRWCRRFNQFVFVHLRTYTYILVHMGPKEDNEMIEKRPSTFNAQSSLWIQRMHIPIKHGESLIPVIYIHFFMFLKSKNIFQDFWFFCWILSNSTPPAVVCW